MITRKKIEKIIVIILENLPAVTTIGFSTYIVVRSQALKMTVDELLLWIISLLGLLATAILIEKLGKLRRIEHYTELTHDYLIKQGATPSLDAIFLDRKSLSPLEKRLQFSKEVIFTGGSLFRISTEYLGFLEQKAQEGCKLKFLLVEPRSETSRLVAQYIVYEISDPATYDEQIKNSLTNLWKLQQTYEKLVEIRVSQCVPPFGLLITDPTKAHGTIQVEIYALAVPTRNRPEFTLLKDRDPYWHTFFLRQFDKVWDLATPWKP
jgi:hypothetical protein